MANRNQTRDPITGRFVVANKDNDDPTKKQKHEEAEKKVEERVSKFNSSLKCLPKR